MVTFECLHLVQSISIIIPVHNGLHTLDRAIASIKNQTYPHWELIAVDDASTDESCNYHHGYAPI